MKVLEIRAIAILALILGVAGVALAAGPADTYSVLRPPKGAKVAIVVFEDLQCPMCAQVAPLLDRAGQQYNIPVIRHDFPLPKHSWSYNAAVLARYFDTHSQKLGDEFRDQVFAHQLEITPGSLHGFAERFATDHKVDLPFMIDPQGKLAAEVNADRDLGNRIGINHTPTVYVVTNKNSSQPYVEVTDTSQLFQTIDRMRQ
ncbi:MAG TPA: thioredoxin domain-containing protein [Terriglobales bacterium]|nr:thioredoxin domain-containing protein [Terriglobales bacterium]